MQLLALREMCPNTEFFLNTGKYGLEKAPYFDTVNAMWGHELTQAVCHNSSSCKISKYLSFMFFVTAVLLRLIFPAKHSVISGYLFLKW